MDCIFDSHKFFIIEWNTFQFASAPMLLVDKYPWLRFFIPTYYRYSSNGSALQNFFLKHIEQHEQQMSDDDQEPKDFIDAYLREIRQSKQLDRYKYVYSK